MSPTTSFPPTPAGLPQGIPSDRIRIALAEDQTLLREMLTARLSENSRLQIIAAVGCAEELLDLARQQRVDVALFDIEMPGRDSFSVAKELLSIAPEVGVIFLSAHDQDANVDRAIDLGARGFLSKNEPPSKLEASIIQVAEGGVGFSEAVRRRLVDPPEARSSAHRSKSRLSTLTERELEIFKLVAEGLSHQEVARRLELAVKTVQNHSRHVMDKLDIHDRVGLTRFAIREGLIQP
ncbi:MAG: response regulator [Planctomycetota bacterium]|jgi:DNA-binding NarL/FixJ family response regulator